MKYEMIFGDEALFDGAPEDVDMIGYSGGFYKNSPDGPMYCCGCTFTTDEYLNKGFIAMRRVVAEPKHWTWEDKKAGRLPEAGCRVDFCHKLNTNWRTGEIKYIDNQVAVIKADDIDRPFVYEFDRVELKPIETPAEKSQREENEFVKSEMKNTTLSMEWSCVYERGLRAAYRKLKGGE